MRDARSRDERIRRGDLAGAVGDARALAGDVDAITQRIAHHRTAIRGAAAGLDGALVRGATIATIAQFERYLRRLRHDLEAARGELVRARARHRGQLAAVDVARGRLTLARAEREVIERHFAAWRAERRKLTERRED
jgi:hypothetical protein